MPKQGVQIETDPKATSVNNATALGDDEGAIEALIKRLQVCYFDTYCTFSTFSLLGIPGPVFAQSLIPGPLSDSKLLKLCHDVGFHA